ncbi:hypothetical protein ACSQ67_011466 [Phaseolus vulgaris]
MNRYNPSNFSKEKSKDNIAEEPEWQRRRQEVDGNSDIQNRVAETKSTKQDTFRASEFVKYPIDNKEIESFLKFHNGRKKPTCSEGGPFSQNRRVLHRHDQIHFYRDRTATVTTTLEIATVTTTLEIATVAATPETAIVTTTSKPPPRPRLAGLSLFSDRRMQPRRMPRQSWEGLGF